MSQIAAAVRNARKHERSLHFKQRELALLQQQREQLARKEQLLDAHRASLLGDLAAEQQRVRTLQAEAARQQQHQLQQLQQAEKQKGSLEEQLQKQQQQLEQERTRSRQLAQHYEASMQQALQQLMDAQEQCQLLQDECRSLKAEAGDEMWGDDAAGQHDQGSGVQLRPLRDGAHFAAGDVQELQVLLQEFNLRGNRIRDLILGILQLLVRDGEGERVSTEELQAMVKLPGASSLYDQARIMGHVQEARHARFIKESPFYSISADAGDVAGEKRNFMVVSGHLAALGYGVLCRMGAVHLISGSGAHQFQALYNVWQRHGISLAPCMHLITDAASPNHKFWVLLHTQKQTEITLDLARGHALPATQLGLPPGIGEQYVVVRAPPDCCYAGMFTALPASSPAAAAVLQAAADGGSSAAAGAATSSAAAAGVRP